MYQGSRGSRSSGRQARPHVSAVLYSARPPKRKRPMTLQTTQDSAAHDSPATVVKEDLVVGSGARAEPGHDIVVHYVGTLRENGRQFDSSRVRRDPLDFALGAGDVIRGWEDGIPGMRVGGKRRLTIPAALAYGEQGCGGVIPPNADLVFEVELLEVA